MPRNQDARYFHFGLRLGVTALIGLASTQATAARPGDLDPAFGDVGRVVGTTSDGPAWAIESLDSGSYLIAGGEYGAVPGRGPEPFSIWMARGFVRWTTADASVAWRTPAVAVLDLLRQPDGGFVAVGKTANWSRSRADTRAVLYRFSPDGIADTTFGVHGLVELPLVGAAALTSADLDLAGRIIVAGHASGNLVLARVLPDGAIDTGFDWKPDLGSRVLVGTSARVVAHGGGYRVLAQEVIGDVRHCVVLGLTETGALDAAFGNGGITSVAGMSGDQVACTALAPYGDGRLLVGGSRSRSAFIRRLSGNGALDTTFEARGLEGLTSITTVALASRESRILLGARGATDSAGAYVLRLLASGAIDALFGDGGRTAIDLPNDGESFGEVTDFAMLDDGSALLAGAARSPGVPRGAWFVARLLGDAADRPSPGVIGIERVSLQQTEGSTATFQVRRTGGRDGPATATFRAVAGGASEREDFLPVAGQLTWADGDSSTREIQLRILADSGAPEGPESLSLVLEEITGSGAGSRTGHVLIDADGAPAGQLAIAWVDGAAEEISAVARVHVVRRYYFEGEVSVTVEAESQSATAGMDFAATRTTIRWADGDDSERTIDIPIIDDSRSEADETFAVRLVAPTGGAILSIPSQESVIIGANDQSSSPPQDDDGGGNRAGGGRTDEALLLLACAALLARRPSQHRRARSTMAQAPRARM